MLHINTIQENFYLPSKIIIKFINGKKHLIYITRQIELVWARMAKSWNVNYQTLD